MTPAETQVDRTRLAWNRTLAGILAVGCFGALHSLVVGRAWDAAVTSVVALVAIIPVQRRRIRLRHGSVRPGWEPAVLAACCAVVAAAVTLVR